MALDTPYSLDFFNKITNIQFGGAWLRIRAQQVSAVHDRLPGGADGGVSYNITFPASAGGTPGFSLTLPEDASPGDGFPATSLPFRFVETTSVFATAEELSQSIKTGAGLGTIGFYQVWSAFPDFPGPGFGIPTFTDNPFSGWMASFWFQPNGELTLPLTMTFQSSFSELGPPPQVISDVSYFASGKISAKTDLAKVTPTTQANLTQEAPPNFPTNTVIIGPHGKISVSGGV